MAANWIVLRGKFWTSKVGERWMTLDLSQVQFVTTSVVEDGYGHETPSVLIRVSYRDVMWLCADEDEQKRRYDWLSAKLLTPVYSDSESPALIEEITNNLEDV